MRHGEGWEGRDSTSLMDERDGAFHTFVILTKEYSFILSLTYVLQTPVYSFLFKIKIKILTFLFLYGCVNFKIINDFKKKIGIVQFDMLSIK